MALMSIYAPVLYCGACIVQSLDLNVVARLQHVTVQFAQLQQ
jgi:hypothetical protein